MIKLFHGFKKSLFIRKFSYLKHKEMRRCIHRYGFDTDEGITENFLENVMLIGINLPDSKNALTESAVDKLCESFNYFTKTDEISVGILHGLGGNFCTGLDPSEKTLEKSGNLLEVMNRLNKPLIASLSGYTTNFGFHLATMCDIRVMEETAVAGFGEKKQRSQMPDFLVKKLILTVGLAGAMELISVWGVWNAKDCVEKGFVNRSVTCGCSLGQAVSWAQSIAKDPLETLIKEKSQVLSVLNTINTKV